MKCSVHYCQFLGSMTYAGAPVCKIHHGKVSEETIHYYKKRIVEDERKEWKLIKWNTFANRGVIVNQNDVDSILADAADFSKKELNLETYQQMQRLGHDRKSISAHFGITMATLNHRVSQMRKGISGGKGGRPRKYTV